MREHGEKLTPMSAQSQNGMQLILSLSTVDLGYSKLLQSYLSLVVLHSFLCTQPPLDHSEKGTMPICYETVKELTKLIV